VSHNEENESLTNIYVLNDGEFSLSLLNNIRSLVNGNCDFEKVLGLEGVYIVNVYDIEFVNKRNTKKAELESYRRTVHNT
jgi:predicted phosphodiesterase